MAGAVDSRRRLAAALGAAPGAARRPPGGMGVAGEEPPEFWAERPGWIPEADTAPLPLPADDETAAARGRVAGLADRVRRRRGASVRRWLPEGVRGARLDPGRPGAIALAIVTAIAALAAAVGVWAERPRAEVLPAGPTAGLSPLVTATSAAAGPDGGPIVVSVVGKVVRPGLVDVPAGARLADALEAAGGPVPGTDVAGLNLARRLSDGEQVVVGAPAAPVGAGEPAAPAAAAAAGGAGSGTRVDLNTATVAQLDGLPGVGPVTAQRILDWRTRNGSFSRVDQLREIDGIGERKFGQLRDLVVVG